MLQLKRNVSNIKKCVKYSFILRKNNLQYKKSKKLDKVGRKWVCLNERTNEHTLHKTPVRLDKYPLLGTSMPGNGHLCCQNQGVIARYEKSCYCGC